MDRISILKVLLKRYRREPAKFDLSALAKASNGFTGAEIEQCIVSAMFTCFADKQREFSTKDLLADIDNTTPQSKINEADIAIMREQAKGKLRMVQQDGVPVQVSEELRSISV